MSFIPGGGGAARPLTRDEGMVELHGDCTAPVSHCLNMVVQSLPLYPRSGLTWRDNYPEGPTIQMPPQLSFIPCQCSWDYRHDHERRK